MTTMSDTRPCLLASSNFALHIKDAITQLYMEHNLDMQRMVKDYEVNVR